jgi:hypothetical protein
MIVQFITLIFRAIGDFRHPHIWRQVDTLAVSARYWNRWSVETVDFAHWIPAVLNSGDTRGIMPMEFPLLNLLGAPFFIFGPTWGQVAAIFVHGLVCIAVTWATSRAWHRGGDSKIFFFGISAEEIVLWIPVVSVSVQSFTRFMPDYLSAMLVLWAIGLSWDRKNRKGLSLLLASLGLLMKPPSVIVFAIFFLSPLPLRRVLNSLGWVLPSISVTAFYYTIGMQYLEFLREIPSLFAVKPRDPIRALISFFSQGLSLLDLGIYGLSVPALLVALVGILSLDSLRKEILIWLGHLFEPSSTESKNEFYRIFKVFFVLVLQVLFIATLDGAHSFVHNYYFIGTSFVVSLLFLKTLQFLSWKPFRFLLLALPLLHLIELFLYQVRPVFSAWQSGAEIEKFQCRQLIERNPNFPWKKGDVFRSVEHAYPEIALCCGERTGSSVSSFGLYYSGNRLPDDCERVDSTQKYQLAVCGR